MTIRRSVSLYSLQEPYYLGKMNLEGCIKAVKEEIGADGIEYLVDEMPLPSIRSRDRQISDEDLAVWNDYMQKYQTFPAAYDTTYFTKWYANRCLTNREHVWWIRNDLKTCARMGFPVYRTGIMRHEDVDILSECFGYAEQLGVQIAVEVHTPRGLHTWWTQDFLNEIEKKHAEKCAGFVVDFAIFTTGMTIADRNLYLNQGANPGLIDRIDSAFRAGSPLTDEEIVKAGGDKVELEAAAKLRTTIHDDPAWMGEVLPYVRHCHGKFYEMTEDCREPSIDYEGVVGFLKDHDWNGVISSEYEGQRPYFEMGMGDAPDPVEQIRRHQIMLKRLIGE